MAKLRNFLLGVVELREETAMYKIIMGQVLLFVLRTDLISALPKKKGNAPLPLEPDLACIKPSPDSYRLLLCGGVRVRTCLLRGNKSV